MQNQIHHYFSSTGPQQPQGSHAYTNKAGQAQLEKGNEFAPQRGSRSSQGASQGNGNVSKVLKQSLKDFQHGLKPSQQHDGQAATGNALGIKVGPQAHQGYGSTHGGAGHVVSSTKAAKRQSLGGGPGGGYATAGASGPHAAAQYSHRGEELSFLNKLTQQNLQHQQQAERREGTGHDGGQQSSNRGLQGMYLGGGVGSHAPNAMQISLNSPKYGQALSFMG